MISGRRSAVLAAAALVVLATAGGCDRFLGYAPVPSAPPDATPPPDAVPRDAAQPPDGPPRDLARDGGADDSCGPCEAAIAEGCCEPVAVDAGAADGPGPDLPATAPPACTAEAAAVAWNATMTVCTIATKVAQCAAHSLCAPPWQLCTASRYLALGGAAEGPPDGGTYWLAACVRDTSGVFPPTDAICPGDCSGWLTGPSLADAWACSGSSFISNKLFPLGVQTMSQCHRIGADLPATAGYWQGRRSDVPLGGAVCCL